MFLKLPVYLFKLWLNGIIFILFTAGYLFYWFLKVFRLMQRKKWLFITAVTAFIVSGTGFFIAVYLLYPFGDDHRPVEFIIAPKMSLRSVADTLKQKKIIRSSAALIAWMRFKNMERDIQAGLVTFTQGDGVMNAGRKLLHASPIEITLMVPEGLTIEQTAHHIVRTIPIDTSEFIALCRDTAFILSCGGTGSSLEGYLFPETYRFPEEVTAREIIRKMVAKHFEVWKNVEIRPDLAETYSHHQLVTLASIIEREATLLSEQPHISSVFYNRLAKGYPLGADPTVRFALKKFGGPLRVSELNTPSPYNTRRYAGLPPGPICSPGRGALQAAAKPLDTKDLYFVAKWDGSGAHDFSRTNAEHERKKREIRRRNRRRIQRKAADEK